MRRPNLTFVALVVALVAGGWVTWAGWGNPDVGVFVFVTAGRLVSDRACMAAILLSGHSGARFLGALVMALLAQALNSDPAAHQQPPLKRSPMAEAAVGDHVRVYRDRKPGGGVVTPRRHSERRRERRSSRDQLAQHPAVAGEPPGWDGQLEPAPLPMSVVDALEAA
jgi:hypothetical protein